jgi:hypothetical protein
LEGVERKYTRIHFGPAILGGGLIQNFNFIIFASFLKRHGVFIGFNSQQDFKEF